MFLFVCRQVYEFNFAPRNRLSRLKFSVIFIPSGHVKFTAYNNGYRLEVRGIGVRFLAEKRDFLFSTASRPTLGPTQLPIQWVPGALSPGVKQQGRKFDRPPLFSAEVKNSGAIPPLKSIIFWDMTPCSLLQFNRLHGVISQKMILFITTAARTSNPIYLHSSIRLHVVVLN
jgi:hypothetical protein